jgi:hypothetical protein
MASRVLYTHYIKRAVENDEMENGDYYDTTRMLRHFSVVRVSSGGQQLLVLAVNDSTSS